MVTENWPTITEVERHTVAAQFYQDTLDDDAKRRLMLPTEDELDTPRYAAIDATRAAAHAARGEPMAIFGAGLDYLIMRDSATMERQSRAVLNKTVRDHLARGERGGVEGLADVYLERNGLFAPDDGPDYKLLCQDISRAWVEAMKALDGRDRGEWTHAPTDPIRNTCFGAHAGSPSRVGRPNSLSPATCRQSNCSILGCPP